MYKRDYVIVGICLAIIGFQYISIFLSFYSMKNSFIEEESTKQDLKKEHLEYIKERESDARYLEKRRNRPFQFE